MGLRTLKFSDIKKERSIRQFQVMFGSMAIIENEDGEGVNHQLIIKEVVTVDRVRQNSYKIVNMQGKETKILTLKKVEMWARNLQAKKDYDFMSVVFEESK